MAAATKPSWIVRIPTPLWLLGLIVIALLVDLALQLPPIVQHRPAGIVLLVAGIAPTG